MNKKLVLRSMAAFWGTFVIIFICHLISGAAGVHIDYSISKYVGLSFPSAIAFLLANIFVSVSIYRYLAPRLKTGLERGLIKVIVVGLTALSLFPFGLFDTIIPEPLILGRTPITLLHMISSRTMFVAMGLFALVGFFLKKKHAEMNIIFVIFAATCIVTYLFFPSFFWSIDIVFESVYIALFFLVALEY